QRSDVAAAAGDQGLAHVCVLSFRFAVQALRGAAEGKRGRRPPRGRASNGIAAIGKAEGRLEKVRPADRSELRPRVLGLQTGPDDADGEVRCVPPPTDDRAPMPTLARHATRQRAASDIAMQVTVRVLNLGLGVFVTALLVRSLGTTEYGEWGTTLLVLGLVAYFTNFGFEGVALREAAKEPETEHEWIGAVILMRLVLLGPVMALCFITLFLLPHTEQMLIAGAILIVAMPFGGMGA